MSAFEVMEVQEDRIEVACPCGARYRLPARQAGGWARCRVCTQKRRVPLLRTLSFETRRVILREFGIDAHAAQEAYEVERTLRCKWCERQVSRGPGRKSDAAPLCSTCRDLIGEEDLSMDMDSMLADLEELEELEELSEAQPLTHWARSPEFSLAARKTLAYVLLFMAGFTGFAYTVLGYDLLDSALVAMIVTALGAFMVFQGEYGDSRVRAAAVT